MGFIFSIASQKGGVGKTTTAAQLGIALAEKGKNTLIIDADPQGGLMNVFQPFTPDCFSGDSAEHGLYDVFCGKAELSDITKPTLWNTLQHIQPGVNGETSALKAFEDAQQAEGLLKEALRQAVTQYDVILIDCPPGMGVVVTSALNASDYIMIPVQCEPLSLRTFPIFIRYLINLKNTRQIDFELSGILMTMADENDPSSKNVISQIRNYFDSGSIFQSVIPRDPALNQIFTDPLRVHEIYHELTSSSPGIREYQRLGADLIRQYQL